MKSLKIAVVLLGLWSGLAFAHSADHLSCADGLKIKNAYVKPLMPGQDTTTAYLTLENNTQKEFVLVDAYSDVAKRTDLHEVEIVNGKMKMSPVDVRLMPGSKLVMKASDIHLMLTGVNTDLHKGMTVPLCLQFEGIKDALCTNARVANKRK